MKMAEMDLNRCGGILADEMGLGKTLQAIQLIYDNIDEVKPTLVVVPKSLVDHWFDEIKRHGKLSVIKYTGPGRKLCPNIAMINATDVYITTYDCVTIDFCKRPNYGRQLASVSTGMGKQQTHPQTSLEPWDMQFSDNQTDNDEDSSDIQRGSGDSSVSQQVNRREIFLTDVCWGRVVLDEAHRVRNKRTRRFKSIMGLKADLKWCITGTPIQNRLSDLFSLILFLEIYPFSYDFCTNCKDCSVFHLNKPAKSNELCQDCGCPYWKHSNSFQSVIGGPRNSDVTPQVFEQLQTHVLNKIMLRRTVEGACLEFSLPSIDDETISFELLEDERCSYNLTEMRAREAFAELETEGAKYACYFAILVRLRLFTNHRLLITHGTEYGDDGVPFRERINEDIWFESSKILNVLEVLYDLLKLPENKCILFSNFTRMLDLIAFRLVDKGCPYLQFDGRLSARARSRVVEKFNSDATIQVLLVSTQCGGEGLNLQAANFVILIDPWWNPALERQSIHRAYRIGQSRPVKVIRFIAKETIEERIVQLQQKKEFLFDGAIRNVLTSGNGVQFNDMKFLLDIKTIC